MPHFVVECSESVLSNHDESAINEQVHLVANSSGLFSEANIQVRVSAFKNNIVGNKNEQFIHVFVSILEGRTFEQKASLSEALVRKLAEMFPQVPNIGCDIKDLEKGTGFYKSML